MIIYELQVWDKKARKYYTTWRGKDFVRAQVMAAKRYNNLKWQGKKRIISITTKIELKLLHIG
jgi:hypothetical protein